MSGIFKIAIVGSGPAGISAGTHAAELGVSHVLLERGQKPSNTIQEYQKGKLVMAEPGYLPLRSCVPFRESSREEVLDGWQQSLTKFKVNIRYQSEVVKIFGKRGDFTLALAGGETIKSETVILAIGSSNPRKIESPGGDLPIVQYSLADPDEYKNESIAVIGAGDAAIENVLVLAKTNRVCLVNRANEFARAKQANLNAVLRAIEDKRVICYYNSTVVRIESPFGNDKPGLLVLKKDNEEIKIPCSRIIARIGALPPRKFLESCGITYPAQNKDPEALPDLSSKYESNVPGLYIIGALGGYPLIKQALNQGYETVEYILGREIRPADHELLVKRVSALPYRLPVEEILELLRQRIPFFSQLNPLLFREMMLDSQVKVLHPGEFAYQKGEFSTSVYTVVDGEIELDFQDTSTPPYRVGGGEIFGELSLISGQQRQNTASARIYTILVETPRRTLLKLAKSVASVKNGLDQLFIARTIQSTLTPAVHIAELLKVAARIHLETYRTGDSIFKEDDPGDDIYLVRRGSVLLSRVLNGSDQPIRNVRAGQFFGEKSMMNVGLRIESAKAVVDSEIIRMNRESFFQLMDLDKTVLERFQKILAQRAFEDAAILSSPRASDGLGFLVKEGAGEATDLLVIDDSLCVGCDNCETACAETHHGLTRLKRREGPSFENIHIAIACRHCENPSCMTECPPVAIMRENSGEVYINYEICIGCGKCQMNCPYEVIRMAVEQPKRTRLLTWMLTGFGSPPGELAKSKGAGTKKAVKCDLCKDQAAGPACVTACPTGAARRVKSDQFIQLVRGLKA